MSRAGLSLCLAVLLAPPVTAAGPPIREQWIVVAAPAFRAAVAPLVAHRKAQGMQVVVIDTSDILATGEIRTSDTRKLRARLQQLCRAHAGESYILLVGAIEAGSLPQPERIVVPALHGTIGRMKGAPTDNGYGCFDGKRLPTVAVGRLPARTEAEARIMIQKTIDLERDARPGIAKRRLTILAGIPAFNPVVDRLVENLAMTRFNRINPIWSGRAVYTNPQSRFGLPPNQLRKQALAYLAEGQAFTLYLGHSSAEGLQGGPSSPFLDRADWGRLSTGPGVFITFGCNGCQLRNSGKRLFLNKPQEEEGYGVAAIRNPQGPTAVLGSHGVCFASMCQLAADGLFRNAFTGALPHRLGPCWLALLNGIATGKMDFLTYRLLDAADGDSRIPQATQRQEHLEMFVLLGDPALRLPVMSADIQLAKLPRFLPGKPLLVKGKLPEHLHGAKVHVSLERSPVSLPDGLSPVPRQPGAQRDRVLLANHQLANRFALAQEKTTAQEGAFEVSLQVPAKLSGSWVVLRVYASTSTSESMVVERLELPAPGIRGGR